MSTLVERLREVGCDREPFTADHAKCVCRIANEAADEIERLCVETTKVEALRVQLISWGKEPVV